MEKCKKFIINRGLFLMGQVELHKDLAKDHSETKGGGWWHADNENKKMYLYSNSHEFGAATKENIEAALKLRISERLKEYAFFYSPSDSLGVAMREGILLTK